MAPISSLLRVLFAPINARDDRFSTDLCCHYLKILRHSGKAALIQVNNFAITGAVSLLAALVLQAAVVALPVSGVNLELGERLVTARCAFCHTEAGLYNLVERCSNTRGMAYLDDFLTRDCAPDETTRVVVVEYLTCEELKQKHGDEKDKETARLVGRPVRQNEL
jgi:hypothetical protein